MGRRHEPLGQSYSVGDAFNLMEVDRFRKVYPICWVRLLFASCTLPEFQFTLPFFAVFDTLTTLASSFL